MDFLEEQDRFERQKRDMAMQKYCTSHNLPNLPPSDSLYVPTFESAGHRRVRSSEEITDRRKGSVAVAHESTPSYMVQERKPESGRSSDAPPPSQLAARQRRPSIPVQIHQDDLPSSRKVTGAPQRSPSASPRSPTAQPQMRYQFATLQKRLARIKTACAPNIHIEALGTRHLTFSQIAEEVDGYAFQISVWGHIANVENLARIDSRRRKTVELASRTLDRLLERAAELSEACSNARPQDLEIAAMPEIDDDEEYDSDEEIGRAHV